MRMKAKLTAVLAAALAVAGLAGPASAARAATAAPASKAPVSHAQNAPGLPANVSSPCPKASHPGQVTCTVLRRTDTHPADGGTPAGYSPSDLRSAYQLPAAPAGGGTPTIAIVASADDPSAESDLAVYRTQFGLPACGSDTGCFTKTDQNGGTSYPYINSYWAAQDALDLDVASAVCPACKLLLVEANSNEITDLGVGVNTAVRLGATAVEVAGSYEDPKETGYDTQYFDHPGVAITTPAGDAGYSGGTAVPYPGVSPYVTSVGGTSLVRDPNTPRGWRESVFNDGGYPSTASGCSAYEPKPSYQHDADCANTTANDVSAVADPETGIAAYDSYQASGWSEMGGTGGAASLVAAVYALAGGSSSSSSPKSWPYAAPAALNDVTSGSNGYCNGSELCNARAGYDGPSGMGSPRGVLAFAPPAEHGDVTGTVTDASTGKPLPSAAVSAGGVTVYATADGKFDLPVAVGAVSLQVSAFGHDAKTVTTASGSVSNVALSPMPTTTLSGKVTDAGHGWPVLAKVVVRGMPSGTFYSSQATGTYQVTVPAGVPETIEVSPVYPGYQPVVENVTAAGGQDVPLTPDPSTCSAPGYAYTYQGMFQDFGSSSSTASSSSRSSLSAKPSLSARPHAAASGPPAGWTVTDGLGTGYVWAFNDPGQRYNKTGGSGGFAIEDGLYYGGPPAKDSTLTSPSVDLSGVASPVVGFDTDLFDYDSATASVDLSTDGGTTWQNIWQHTDNVRTASVQIPVPQAAHASDVRVRFHYVTGQYPYDYWWQVDNVYVGQRTCSPQAGGLLTGTVTDKNTGAALAGASLAGGGASGVTTKADGPLKAGQYWMFVPPGGTRSVTASNGPLYQQVSRSLTVPEGKLSTANFALPAGRLRISTSSLSTSQVLGSTVTKTVRITNTGTAPASLAVAPYTAAAAASTPAGSAWKPIPAYPIPLVDPAATYGNGLIYSAGGMMVNQQTGAGTVTAKAYVYNPATKAWRALPPMPHARHGGSAAFIGGKLYVAGGMAQDDSAVPQLDIYDPRTDKWTSGRTAPTAYAAEGTAVIGSTLYLIGGCNAVQCGYTDVLAYNATTDQWHRAAPYPVPVGWEGCGAINGAIYCAGGLNQIFTSKSAYAYNPAKNAWHQIADMPTDLYGGGATAANGQLVLDGGLNQGGHVLVNDVFGYNPKTGTWSSLPGQITAMYRTGTACGIYQIAGVSVGSGTVANSSMLSGFGKCGGPASVRWLSLSSSWLTVKPGATVSLQVGFNAKVLSQPGTSSATLEVSDNTPYPVSAIKLRLTATPPKTWAKLTGVVSGRACTGVVSGLRGATVQINGAKHSFTVTTGANGRYTYWLDANNSPLNLIVALRNWQPQLRTVKIRAGKTTTANFLLKHPTCH